jgi:TPR repeat protein
MKQHTTSPCDLAFQAEGGDSGAQYQLGVLFLLGDQVEQDPDAAYRWLAKAASAQHADAQSLLDKVAQWRAAEAPAKSPWYSREWKIFKSISPLALAAKLRAQAESNLKRGAQEFRNIRSRRLALRIRIPGDMHDSFSLIRRRKAVQSLHPS